MSATVRIFAFRSFRVVFLAFVLALLGTLTIAAQADAAMSWRVERLHLGFDRTNIAVSLDDVSCASEHLCVAVGGEDILVSTDPTAAKSVWQPEHVSGWGSPGVWARVACPSEQLCVAMTEESAVTSTDPAQAGSWRLSHINTPRPSWAPPEAPQGVVYLELSCPTVSFCVAQGGNGYYSDLATTTDPTGGSSAWTVTPGALYELDGEGYAMGASDLACAPEGFCLERDAHPSINPNGTAGSPRDTYLMTSSSLAVNPGGWQVSSGGLLGTVEPFIDDAACPSAGLCVAVDSEGDIDASETPSDANSWSGTRVTQEDISSISCASTTFCAVGAGDEMLTSTNPTGGHKAWSASRIPPEQDQQTNRGLPIKGALGVGTFLSCPTSSLCVGIRGDEVITGTPGKPGAKTRKPSHKKTRHHSHR